MFYAGAGIHKYGEKWKIINPFGIKKFEIGNI